LTFNASPNTSCDPLNPNGTLEVSAATNGVDAGNGSTFAWFVGDGTTVPYTGTVAVVGNTSTITDLSAGVYTVTVTDSNTGCTHTDKFTVDDDQVYPEVTAVAVLDKDVCNDSGSITITSVSVGNISDYNYTWYRDSVSTASIVASGAVTVLDNTSYIDFEEGTYYVTATSALSCTSTAPFEAIVDNVSIDP